MSAIGRRNFLSLIACVPGLGWLNPKPESAYEGEILTGINRLKAAYVAEPKCYQMVRWISADFETPPWHEEEFVGEHAQFVKFNGKPEVVTFTKRSIGVLVDSEEHGVEVGRYFYFCGCDPVCVWFVGGFERKVTHWALYPAGPHESYVMPEFRSIKDAHEAYEGALNLFLGPVKP